MSPRSAGHLRPSSRRRHARLAIALALGTSVGVGVAIGFSGCVANDGVTDAKCPPIEDFRSVSALLEQRCGTLDCHGDVARPFKLYGRIGLRAPIFDPDSGIDEIGRAHV